ncbi:hypothetical protein NBRC3280_2816 [Acetobacter pasteurianus NBRC 3280]|uniref:Cell shape determination protein CcmA n=1 Tax=Acetobacter pasteurianus NBRC 3278 TaxID=1226660 RepID=A0A401X6H6_ACEPA|nr:polymer-forming cytoskeletal protein [Acetobacter pasteurianus]GCD60076.1 hypothetical protein NBRC3277_2651 [Acetobacter pasteurianus NBRC 3277]GCD63510.1 hypothetical protein NBRC3278_2603 [Acetobacter pasteurianus NBRC 3278]GCD70181.1 hypothetical protein NBRC3280_2816 [Acetobacter pasteurianus NBRC 3280]
MSENQAADKGQEQSPECVIPHGLSIRELRGSVPGTLIINGQVDQAEISATTFILGRQGEIVKSKIDADTIIIQGEAKSVIANAGRVIITEQARLMDAKLVMANATGCAIAEEAHLEGDVQIMIGRKTPSATASKGQGKPIPAPENKVVEPSPSSEEEKPNEPVSSGGDLGDSPELSIPLGDD